MAVRPADRRVPTEQPPTAGGASDEPPRGGGVDAVALLGRARALPEAMRHGARPAGGDRTAQELSDVAAHEGMDARRVEVLRAAGDLVAARSHISARPDDVAQAEGYYRQAGADPSVPGACEALRVLADFVSGSPGEALAARERYTAACGHDGQADAETDDVLPGTETIPPREVTGQTHGVHRVVLDPGHGGNDPGAIGPTGLRESVVNLDVARRVADRLATRYGIQVVLTRDRDVYVPLEDRAAHANAARAELFVSIHCNSAPNAEARGVSTYILDTQSDRVAARVTAREGELVVDDPLASPDLPRILADLRLAHQGSRSTLLAVNIQTAMLHDLRVFYPQVSDAGVHPAAFHVLVTARMPAVLVELSFISNPVEETRLRSDAFRDVLASGIARGIADFAPTSHVP